MGSDAEHTLGKVIGVMEVGRVEWPRDDVIWGVRVCGRNKEHKYSRGTGDTRGLQTLRSGRDATPLSVDDVLDVEHWPRGGSRESGDPRVATKAMERG